MKSLIYIQKNNQKTWEKIGNKSGWVNEQLEKRRPADAYKVPKAKKASAEKKSAGFGNCKAGHLTMREDGKCMVKKCKFNSYGG